MRRDLMLALLLLVAAEAATADDAESGNRYADPKIVFDFFFASPAHMDPALHWLRSTMNPLMEAPYDLAPEFMDIVVVVHGTEIVTLARHNYGKYQRVVERMRYYASLGVKFKVCSIAAGDYGYNRETFFDFVDVVPSAMVEIAYWQQRGYGLLVPQIHEKRHAIEEIR